MATAEQLLKIARSYIGSSDGDGFIRKYNAYTGIGIPLGSAWCAIFVSYVARMAGVPTSEIPNYHNCTAGMNAFKKAGRWKNRSGYTPKTGDIVLFDWNRAVYDGLDHTGIIERVESGMIYTIEGNAGNNGVCMRNTHSINSTLIEGYGTPKYTDSTDKGELTMAQYDELKKMINTANGTIKTLENRLDVFLKAEKAKKTAACPDWGKESMQWAIENKIVQGDGKLEPTIDNVRPQDNVTRAEAVTMLKRFSDSQ